MSMEIQAIGRGKYDVIAASMMIEKALASKSVYLLQPRTG
jgi:hypothetical protein